jgi:hypothetical protein
MPTLSDCLTIERDRCRLLVQDFSQIGTAGAFGAALVREAVAQADAAARKGEAECMQRALRELQRYTDLRPAHAASTGTATAGAASLQLPPRQLLCAPAQRFLQAA